MASQHRASFAGPFTMRCPTCPPIPADMFRIPSQLTCPCQRPFRDPALVARYPASYPATATWRSGHDRCGFLSAFAHRHSLLGHPVPARRIPPFLTVGLPGRQTDPDSVGVSAFRTCEKRPGWVPSLLRGGGVIPVIAISMTGACRFSTASPVLSGGEQAALEAPRQVAAVLDRPLPRLRLLADLVAGRVQTVGPT